MKLKKVEGGHSTATFSFTRATPRTQKRALEGHRRLNRRAQAMQRRDLKRAFDLMHKNIWGWWD